ncbi:hypothetical protein ACFFUA_38160, partial [Streptomyces heliomycini]
APLPAVLNPGQTLPLEAWLARGGEPWQEAPEDLAISATLLDAEEAPQAEVWLARARQGDRFLGELTVPDLSGAARLRIQARGEGIVRQRDLAVNVQPLLGLLDEAEEGLGDGDSRLGPLGELFHEDLATGREGEAVPDSAADRFIDFINDLPAQAAALWREGRPWVERRGATF